MIDIKEELEQVRDSKGRNLYVHLQQVLTKLKMEDVLNAGDLFEDYSHAL